MGAVPVIIIGLCPAVDQVQKGDDAVFGRNEICRGGNARIQKGDGNGAVFCLRTENFFCGNEPLFQRHGAKLLSYQHM